LGLSLTGEVCAFPGRDAFFERGHAGSEVGLDTLDGVEAGEVAPCECFEAAQDLGLQVASSFSRMVFDALLGGEELGLKFSLGNRFVFGCHLVLVFSLAEDPL
jgi:hypothetical protein